MRSACSLTNENANVSGSASHTMPPTEFTRSRNRCWVASASVVVRLNSPVRSATARSRESSARRRAALTVAMKRPRSAKTARRGTSSSSTRSESSGGVKKYAKASVARPHASNAGRSPHIQPVITIATRDSWPAAITAGRSNSARPTVVVTHRMATPYRLSGDRTKSFVRRRRDVANPRSSLAETATAVLDGSRIDPRRSYCGGGTPVYPTFVGVRSGGSGSFLDRVGVEPRLRAVNERVAVIARGHGRARLRRIAGGGHRGRVAGRLAGANRAGRAGGGARAHRERGDRREHERDLLGHPHRLPLLRWCVLCATLSRPADANAFHAPRVWNPHRVPSAAAPHARRMEELRRSDCGARRQTARAQAIHKSAPRGRPPIRQPPPSCEAPRSAFDRRGPPGSQSTTGRGPPRRGR